ncbi:GDYXXLXY domain-containing protein [Neobacillus sp. OS1-32]|uniref:GDYXXLXY domain-containing protein n=1 Tax=Neobacillus sp. OS1-32 TaxID=3070682 RepID=UPI0027E15701|nr:GDYXXLXY domain-containing protein [Neobacillus sp. OS1-32]WML28919.1 GDYXXLXY domain-containing protein [Neobacillus sp. OS1-32]
MHKRTKQLIVACAVPVLILLGMCFQPLLTLFTGQEVTLQTKPVDPTDLFRGDYVILRYEAEEVPKELVETEVIKQLERNGSWGIGEQNVYVVLKKKDGIDHPVKVTLNKPKNGVFLKGKLDYIGTNGEGMEVAFIQYSLDKYYVEDNTGTKWEEASTKGQILAKAKVNNGYAILTDIEIGVRHRPWTK